MRPELASEVQKLRDLMMTADEAPPPPTTAAPVSVTTIARPTPPPQPQAAAPTGTCASVIAAVEGRGLFPAPGFAVICPGNAMGHAGMTCFNIGSLCPHTAEIVIQYVAAYVVANEFENSRILSGAPARCHQIDCGHLAYGF